MLITPQSVVAAMLWILGLAGALATISYMSWYRRLRGWPWRELLAMPRLLSPLCLSLAVFTTGMTMAAIVTNQPPPWWATVAWGGLALFFAVQCMRYTHIGRRWGWDAPIEGTKQP